jgi:protein tyrosine/serine phosphatase
MNALRLLDALYNFHWVAKGEAARSAQPYLGCWRFYLTRNGIRSIVNLRGSHPQWGWWRTETRIAQELAIAHTDIAVNSRRLTDTARFVELIDFFDTAPKPFLIKCSGGQDRTSFVSALYLLHTQGWTAWDAAMAHFARFPYLHFPKRHQRWLKLFFEYARKDANGMPVGEWLKCRYDQARFADWLTKNGHGKTFKGLHKPHA